VGTRTKYREQSTKTKRDLRFKFQISYPKEEKKRIMAELNIRERQAGDVTVLDMDGRITIGEGSVALRSAVRRLLEEGKKKLLLNLAGVGYIDSSGIGELVSSYTAMFAWATAPPPCAARSEVWLPAAIRRSF